MRQIKIATFWIGFGMLCFMGCTKEKRAVLTGSASSGPSGPASLSTIQSDIFLLGCAVSGCHDSRPHPAANLSMVDVSTTYHSLVNQQSTQALDKLLIVPGDPDNSYFMAKLRGTHLDLGGSGDPMPQYSAILDGGELDRIAQWIADGAQNN